MEKASTGDVISGVLKTRKAEGCGLQACNFLKRNSIRDHFLEISCKFQGTFNKFGKELVFSLHKKYFSEYTNAFVRVFDRFTKCKNLSYYFTKKWLKISKKFKKFLKQPHETFTVESVFSIVIS